MKLNIQERLTILSVLPKEGTFNDMFFGQQIAKSVDVSAEENDKYNIKREKLESGEIITWNQAAMSEEKECHLSTEHIKMLNDVFLKLNEDKKLNMTNFSTAAKIFDAAKELNI